MGPAEEEDLCGDGPAAVEAPLPAAAAATAAAKEVGERPPLPGGDRLCWLVSAEASSEVEEAEKSVGEEGPLPDWEEEARLRAPLESILMGEVVDLRGGDEVLLELMAERRLFGLRPLTMEDGVMETTGGGCGSGEVEAAVRLLLLLLSFCGERCFTRRAAAAAALVSWSSRSLFCHSRA